MSVEVDAQAMIDARLARKLKLAESLSCRDHLEAIDIQSAQLTRALTERIELVATAQQAKGAIAEAETLVALGVIDGKNEPERKLARERAIQTDPAAIGARAAYTAVETALAQHDAWIDEIKRSIRQLERRVEYQTAALRFLGD